MNKKGCLLYAVGILLLFMGCQPEETVLQPVSFLELQVPPHFPQPVYSFENNPTTPAGFKLGRKLFYDPLLSKNGTISCGSCHFQEAGFSDPGKAFSLGVDGKPGLRNAPALANLAWFPLFMADGGINHIEVMPIAPLTDSLEMAEDLNNVLAKLQKHPEYPDLFKTAFDSDSITDQKMLYALAQFMGLMVSASSKYDHVIKGEDHFNESEKRGYTLFKQNCGSCHKEPLLTDFSFRNNGLDIQSKDAGRARVTQNESDYGKFKVPSLRNVELTYPYMHDGRFTTLSEVLDHYTNGIQSAPNLDPELINPIQMNSQDKEDLLRFLSTLTDYEYISDPSFSKSNTN